MANKIIKYNLTSTGTIPSYIESGGFHPKVNSNASLAPLVTIIFIFY